jgi:hypothetical protein
VANWSGVQVSDWNIYTCCVAGRHEAASPTGAPYALFHQNLGFPDLNYAQIQFTIPNFSLPNHYTSCPVKTYYYVAFFAGVGGGSPGTATYTWNGQNIPISYPINNNSTLFQTVVQLEIDCVTNFPLPTPLPVTLLWEITPAAPVKLPLQGAESGDSITATVRVVNNASPTLQWSIVYQSANTYGSGSGTVTNPLTGSSCSAEPGACWAWGTAEGITEEPLDHDGVNGDGYVGWPTPQFDDVTFSILTYQDAYYNQANQFPLLTRNNLDPPGPDLGPFQVSNTFYLPPNHCNGITSSVANGSMTVHYTYSQDPNITDNSNLIACGSGP